MMPYPYAYNPYSYSYQAPQQSTGIVWVQGETGAKSYMIAPNTSVLLMDSERQRFYLKSADMSGMPTLRVFDFQEVTTAPQNAPGSTKEEAAAEYVTREELERRLKEVTCKLKEKENDDECIV